MAKKKPAKKKPKPAKRVRITDAEYLEIQIKFSKSAMDGHGGGIDEFFGQQVARLEKQLAALRGKSEVSKNIRKNSR